MNNILENKILSISKSLKSNSRDTGPKLYNKTLNKVIGGRNIQNNSDFSDKVIEIFYNITVPEYYEH